MFAEMFHQTSAACCGGAQARDVFFLIISLSLSFSSQSRPNKSSLLFVDPPSRLSPHRSGGDRPVPDLLVERALSLDATTCQLHQHFRDNSAIVIVVSGEWNASCLWEVAGQRERGWQIKYIFIKHAAGQTNSPARIENCLRDMKGELV